MGGIFYNRTQGSIEELDYMLFVWLLAFSSEELVHGEAIEISYCLLVLHQGND